MLVQVLLLEGDDEGAWREARNGGCHREIWLKLAERRAASHPEDALAVYREQIANILGNTGDVAYQQAVELLRKVEEILIDDHDEFARIMADLRLSHRRKRNLMKLIDAEGW